MIRLYCRGKHGSRGDLCEECKALDNYAIERLALCPFLSDKPTCVNCRVHCYKPQMRDKIKEVMRYAGPRMTYKHPILALMHFIDGRAGKNSGQEGEAR